MQIFYGSQDDITIVNRDSTENVAHARKFPKDVNKGHIRRAGAELEDPGEQIVATRENPSRWDHWMMDPMARIGPRASGATP